VLYEDNTVDFLETKSNRKNKKYVDATKKEIEIEKNGLTDWGSAGYKRYKEGEDKFWELLKDRNNKQPTYIISNRVGDEFFAKKKVQGEQELLEGFSEYNEGKEFRNAIIFSSPKYGKTSY
jgi:hypothetical protein